MNTVTRIFSADDSYELAVRRLVALGVPDREINVLAPDLHGGGAGAAEAGDALFFIRGTGRVIASGVHAQALLQAAGVRDGRRTDPVEAGDGALPLDDVFLFEHALRRRGRVVFVVAPEQRHRQKIDAALSEIDGSDLRTYRDEWWSEICQEEERAVDTDAPHEVDDYLFRLGFEVALHPSRRALTFEEAREGLRRAHPEACDAESFRKGYERGRAHQEALDQTTASAAS